MERRFVRWMGAVVIGLGIALASTCSDSNPASPSPPANPGGGGGNGAPADLVITITGMNGNQSYSPNPASVRVGQRVAWRNADSEAHTSTADGGAFNTGVIGVNVTSAPITMNSAGSFPYHCSLHPTMVGRLTVTQ